MSITNDVKIFFSSNKFTRSQHWTIREIQEYQDKQITKVVRHASQHVPYYQKLFREIKLDIENFNGREDLKKIPFLEKDTLRRHFDEFLADDRDRYGIKWDSTSGSTGKPLKLLMSTATTLNKKAASFRAYKLTGYKFRDKTFSIQSYKHGPDEKFKKDVITNTFMFDAKKLDKDFAVFVAEMMKKERPKYLVGYPFSIYKLGQFLKDSGVEIPPVKAAITAGETLSDERRTGIEEMFKTKVFDYYSHHESVALITECKSQVKHLNEDFAYNEFIYHDEARTVATLVGTGFFNFGMPLIRYKIDDLVELYPEDSTSCDCGISFRKIKRIIGRENDYIQTPEGRVLGNVMEHSIDRAEGVLISQCVQDKIDHIYVNVLVEDGFNTVSFEKIREDMQKRIGSSIAIDFNIVEELEKNKSGKTPFILSKIGNEYV